MLIFFLEIFYVYTSPFNLIEISIGSIEVFIKMPFDGSIEL